MSKFECYGNGYEGYLTKQMIERPISPLARLIGNKWFMSGEMLAERVGVSADAISRLLNGDKVGEKTENKIRTYLEAYKGECTTMMCTG